MPIREADAAIIFLNNVAVTMMEYHGYHESAMTLRSAIFLERMSNAEQQRWRRLRRDDDNDDGSNSCCAIRRMVDDATKRLTNLHREHQHQRPAISDGTMSLPSQPQQDSLLTCNFINDDCYRQILSYHQQQQQTMDVVFRIDHHHEVDYDNDDNSEEEASCNRDNSGDARDRPHRWCGQLNTAILLYNYAVACRRNATSVTSTKRRYRTTMQESISFFQLAYDIIVNELEIFSWQIRNGGGHTKEELEYYQRVIAVAMFVTFHLSHNDDADRYLYPSQRIEYRESHDNLCLLFVNILREYLDHPGTVAKHAAAA